MSKELQRYQDDIERFGLHCKNEGISFKECDFVYKMKIGVCFKHTGIVPELFPEFIRDKDGLYFFESLKELYKSSMTQTGHIETDSCILLAHSYFRRGMHESNNFAPRFLELFWVLKLPEVTKRISLDLDRVRVNLDDSYIMEFDTWYGPKYDAEINKISDGIVKLVKPPGLNDIDVEFFFSSVYSLDIKWETSRNEPIKTFQAESFFTEQVILEKDGELYYPARYVHAEYDLENGYIRHFDGAIHFYTEEEYFSRRDSDFNYNAKSSQELKALSTKLFRIDGELPVKKWIELLGHFFTGNYLVQEYFEGELPKRIQKLVNRRDSEL